MSNLNASDLDAVYPKPSPRVLAKAIPTIDKHARQFIEMSPFCVLASASADGSVDASPRGGNPGFVHVTSTRELLMPDRMGNNRLDSFKNILNGSGDLHLLFFVPGIDEMLRVNGRGAVVTEPDLLKRMVEFGMSPRAVLRVQVTETYFHCGKAAMRSKLWSSDSRVARSRFPSIGQINHDRTALGEPETQVAVEALYKDQL